MAFNEKISGLLGKQKDSQSPRPLTRAELDSVEKELNEITEKLDAERKSREGFGRIMKHPVQVLVEKPENILILCLPISIIVFFAGFLTMVKIYGIAVLFNSTVIDDFAILAILISIIPVAILDLREQSRVKNLEVSLPNFFRDLAGMNDSGMTLPNAVHLVAGAEYGALSPHIKKMDNEMSWGVGFVEAMYRFGKGLGTPLADRSVDLIAKASKAGGDISEVLRAAANDTFEVVNLAQERRNNMLIYVIIVIVSFTVFLFVIAVLVSSFLSTMATAGTAAQVTAASSKFMSRIDLPAYKRLFSHAAMIQGFFSGLCAGQMGEGRVIAGLKYSAIMLIISWVVFRFFI